MTDPVTPAGDHRHVRRSSLSDVTTALGVGSSCLYIAVVSLIFFGGMGAEWFPLRVRQSIMPGFLLACGAYGFLQMLWIWGRNKTKESLMALDLGLSMVAMFLTPVIAAFWLWGTISLGYEGFYMFLGLLVANAFEGLALLMAWSMVATARDEHPAPS